MQENIIIKSKPYNIKIILAIILLIGVLLSIYFAISGYNRGISLFESHDHRKRCYKSELEKELLALKEKEEELILQQKGFRKTRRNPFLYGMENRDQL